MNKVCPKCGKELPREAFYKQNTRKDGLRCWCKVCCGKENRKKYAENIDAEHARGRRYRRSHLEEISQRAHNYYVSHTENILTRNRKWKVSPEGRARVLLYAHERRAKLRGTSCQLTAEETRRVLEIECRATDLNRQVGKGAYHVHHIIPVAKGGTNHPSNLIILPVELHRQLHSTCR